MSNIKTEIYLTDEEGNKKSGNLGSESGGVSNFKKVAS